MRRTKTIFTLSFLLTVLSCQTLPAADTQEKPEEPPAPQTALVADSASCSPLLTLSGQDVVKKLMKEWGRSFNPAGYALAWHFYDRHFIEKLTPLLLASPPAGGKKTKTFQYFPQEVWKAAFEELLFITRRALCVYAIGAFEYRFAREGYKAVLKTLGQAPKDADYEAVVSEATTLISLINAYLPLEEEMQRRYPYGSSGFLDHPPGSPYDILNRQRSDALDAVRKKAEAVRPLIAERLAPTS